MTLQPSVNTCDQGKDPLEEQDEVTSPAFYDLRTLFHEEELSAFILQGQTTQDDLVDNIPVLVTNTSSLEEQM